MVRRQSGGRTVGKAHLASQAVDQRPLLCHPQLHLLEFQLLGCFRPVGLLLLFMFRGNRPLLVLPTKEVDRAFHLCKTLRL